MLDEAFDFPVAFFFSWHGDIYLLIYVTGILTLGVKESSRFNNIFTAVNLLVVLYVVICGFIKADLSNWSLPKPQVC